MNGNPRIDELGIAQDGGAMEEKYGLVLLQQPYGALRPPSLPMVR